MNLFSKSLPLILFLTLPLSAEKKFAASLELLPAGSNLKDVSVPRYDEDYNLASLLKAELMTVVTSDRIDGKLVRLHMFNPDSSKKFTAVMKDATYTISSQLLRAPSKITIDTSQAHIVGRNSTFHLKTRKGYFGGPVYSYFYQSPSKSTKKTTQISPHSTSPTSGLITKIPSLMVSPRHLLANFSSLFSFPSYFLIIPQPPTHTELRVIQERSSSPRRKYETLTYSIDNELAVLTKRSDVLRKNLLDFLTLIQATPASSDSPKPKAKPASASKKDPLSDGRIHIQCKGGMFFDADKGELVYLKNVQLREKRFSMNCEDDLKIFLEKKPSKKKSTASEKEQDHLSQSDDFGTLSQIVGTGNVHLVISESKDKPPIHAFANTVSYNAKTGDIILMGGFPRFQQGKTSMRAQELGLFIKIDKGRNIIWKKGKWHTTVNMPQK